jgi:hypothetical protein
MAKRRIKTDGGYDTLIDTGSSIRNVLREAGIGERPSVVTGSELIMAKELNL